MFLTVKGDGKDEILQVCSSWKNTQETDFASNDLSPTLSDADDDLTSNSTTCSNSDTLVSQRCSFRTPCSVLFAGPHHLDAHNRDASQDLSDSDMYDEDGEDVLSSDDYVYEFRRFENVDLALPADMPLGCENTLIFWEQTAQNLKRLVDKELIGRCSLVALDEHGAEMEMEVDAAALKMWAQPDTFKKHVRLLRVHADVETLRAHAVDCSLCASSASRAHTLSGEQAFWDVWWTRAMCLLGDIDDHHNDDYGCDLDFLCASGKESHCYCGDRMCN
jgi:hypothetical protein